MDNIQRIPNFGLDPYEEELRHSKEMKRLKKHYELIDAVAVAQHGIPRKCACGGRIIHEICNTPKYPTDFDTLPGSRYFSCSQFKDDGLHFRQPWVFGVEEEIDNLLKKVDDQRKTIEDLQTEVQSHVEEIAKLKELVAGVTGVIGFKGGDKSLVWF